MLLIVTSELDAHADAVIQALRDDGFDDILRIDLETLQKRFAVQVDPSVGAFALQSRLHPHLRCESSAISTVWWRRASSQIVSPHAAVPTGRTLDESETYWAARWLVEALPDRLFPFSHPVAMRTAHNKLLQLRIARTVGMRVPETLYTNDKQALLAFAARHGQVVVKPLHATMAADEGRDVALTSNGIAASALGDLLAAEPEVAIYCQERIAKVADIRVNVLPGQTVACRIDTSGLPEGQVDWRMTTFQHPHDVIAMPVELDAQCRALLAALDLKWGAFDFGQTAAGAWVFFECNPNGQWLWVELAAGAPLARIMARQLLAHHQGDDPPRPA